MHFQRGKSKPEMEPGLSGSRVTRSPGQRYWPGRVTGQCVRPSVWPGFGWCAFIVALFLQSNTISANQYPWFRFRFSYRHSTTGLLISVSARNIYSLTCWLSLWRHDVFGFDVIDCRPGRVGSGTRVTDRKSWPGSISGPNTAVGRAALCCHLANATELLTPVLRSIATRLDFQWV